MAPILFENCVPCHRPGGPAPFSLRAYENAAPRADLIADVTRRRYMPPWLPEPGYGEFEGERRLTEEEIVTLRQWAEAEAPRGDPAREPTPPEWPEGWFLGTPDLVVRMEEPYRILGEDGDIFRNFVVPVPVDEARWVRGLDFRPGSRRLVHHANIAVDQTGASRRLDGLDPEPGFDGMPASFGNAASGFILGWTPGKIPGLAPRNLAWRLEPGSDLVLQLHLRPMGGEQAVRGELGLYFAEERPSRSPIILRLASMTVDIPAGERSYIVRDSFRLPTDAEAIGIYPHAHYLGKEVHVWAELPDGETRPLIWIRNWDFDWQDSYRYREPVLLPAGSTLRLRLVYDNSADNLQNPHDPPRRVWYGPESTDEMGDVWIQLLPRTPPDRAVLAREIEWKDLMTRAGYWRLRLGRDPEDADAHYGLAAVLDHLGKQEEAAEGYRRALALRPDLATAHYNLGNLLAAEGATREAEHHYRRALAAEPDQALAHNNLGNILRLAGRLEEAIGHFRSALEARPRYPEARMNLGLALVQEGRGREGMEEMRRALEARPDWPEALSLAARILATHADAQVRSPGEAVRLAERAAALAGVKDARTLHVLAMAYGAAGRFEEAVASAERAAALASETGEEELAREIRALAEQYRQGRAHRQPGD